MTNLARVVDFCRLFEAVKIPLVVTDCDLNLICANQFAGEILPLTLETGKPLDVEDLLQPEDESTFDDIVNESREKGQGTGTLKQKNMEKYFRVKVYHLKEVNGCMVFQFDDVSHVRDLENQFYDHLVDLYNQLEAKEREIVHLRSSARRSEKLSDKS
jgi:hypothetical protein